MTVSLIEADAYHYERATPEWLIADEGDRKAALVRAEDYISWTYRLSVPSTDDLVKRAIMALAPFALGASLVVQATAAIIREKVDGVAEVQYSDRVISDPFPMITAILAPITVSRAGGSMTSARVIL